MEDCEVEFEPECFEIGLHKFQITTISYMPLEILAANQAKGVEISGQKLWCGSLGAASYIMNCPTTVLDADILELGAGTGVLGMLCRKLGSNKIILTDNDPRSLQHMCDDIITNNIDQTVVMELDWFNNECSRRILEQHVACNSPIGNKLIILAGDVLYKRVLLEPFFATVKNCLDEGLRLYGRPAELILCHVPRAGVQQEDVQAAAQAAQVQMTRVEDCLWRNGCCVALSPEDDYSRAAVYVISHLFV